MSDKPVYIRIGGDYYKQIINQDAKGWPYEELRSWPRQAILDDQGKDFLRAIPKFDAFTNIPDNGLDELDILPNLHNLYTPITHTPTEGEWPWTEILLRHVFGDQYKLGLDYIQLLYTKPLQLLPILCPVSRENITGKTTFLNWLRMLFNSNMIVIGNADMHSRFNFHYAHKLIIAIDESRIDKDSSLEKLKALATQPTINIEGKFQNAQPIPFFGHFILCSNYEDNFINAKDEDVRYWIRKLSKPTNNNINIEDDLEHEVPAFLYFITHRKLSTEKQSRMWFSAIDIGTEALQAVRYQSKSWLYKELDELISLYFLKNEKLTEFKADPTDIKTKWLERNQRAEISYIRKVVKTEYKFDAVMCRYFPFEDPSIEQKIGRAFTFNRIDFVLHELPKKEKPIDSEPITINEEINDDLPF
jgi:hypothetical protein